jgi:hypothetical protein
MTSIGLGSNLANTYTQVDKGVQFAIDKIEVVINGNVDDAQSAQTVGKEAGKQMAENMSYWLRGLTSNG